MKKKVVVEKHFLIPKHTVCTDKEKEQVLDKYGASENEMPKIFISDSALVNLKVKVGDMIRIEREDPLTRKTYFYRVVVNE